MTTATLTSKGQITIPKAVRDELGLTAGAQIDFIKTRDGFKVVALKKNISRLKGMFAGRVSKTVSLKVMDDAIGRAVGQRNRRVDP